ncbi:MAG: dephospho-CoA kinase [Clostridia bacterium]|nr:dephospho-CoA kinase [Clostridia bacterium]
MDKTVAVGICGRSGSGKSYISELFSRRGGYHVDTDKVYHELLEPKDGALSECASSLSKNFGDDILDGVRIDRKILADIVFSNKDKLGQLNRITHAYILDETKRQIASCGAAFAVIDAPLLFESGFNRLCDLTVCVVADEATCIRRICERDGVGVDDAKRRLECQISASELVRMCDYVIDNSDGASPEDDVDRILACEGLIEI